MSANDFQDLAKRALTVEEGDLAYAYDCGTGKRVSAAVGYVTVGIGHNIDAHPLSQAVRDLIFKEDLSRTIKEAHLIFSEVFFEGLSSNRKLAIVCMIFHLGMGGFNEFKKMIAAIEREDWQEAIKEMWDSQMGREKRFEARLSRMSLLLNDCEPEEYRMVK
jgi:lysozyme